MEIKQQSAYECNDEFIDKLHTKYHIEKICNDMVDKLEKKKIKHTLNKKILKEKQNEYRLNNMHKIRKYFNNRRKTDINFRIKCNIRSRIYVALNRGIKSAHTMELLGCSIEEVKQHLEKQFKPGMSWDNHGKWHIDHIKPCCSFDLTKPEEQRVCFHYSNLQPLWAEENLSKGGKTISL